MITADASRIAARPPRRPGRPLTVRLGVLMDATQLSCYLIGGDSLLIECAERLLERRHQLRAVITCAPRIERWARERGVPLLRADSDYRAVLALEPFDYLFAITHLAILPDDVISLPRRAAINFHDGPLPRYAGLHTPAWALIQRESSYGVSWHVMTPGADEGDLLKQRTFEIAPGETSLTLNTKCFESGIESFAELLDELATDGVQRVVQDRAQRSYYAKHARPEAACVLRWSRSAEEIEALVRALDFGPYENPLGLAKLAHRDRAYAVARCRIEPEPTAAPPGTLLGFGDDELRVATADGAVALSGFSTPTGDPVAATSIAADLGLAPGTAIEAPEGALADRLTRWHGARVKSEARWQRRLSQLDPIAIPYASGEGGGAPGQRESFELEIPAPVLAALAAHSPADAATAAVAAFLSRLGDKACFDLAFSDAQLRADAAGLQGLVATAVPLRVDATGERDVPGLCAALSAELLRVRRWGTYLLDAIARKPELRARPELRSGRALPIAVVQGDAAEAAAAAPGSAVCFAIAQDGRALTCAYDPNVLAAREAAALRGQIAAFLAQLAESPRAPWSSLALLSADERQRVVHDFNRTASEYRRDACLHELVQEQVERTPDAIAVVFEQHELSYRELNARANRLAHHLRGLGVGPDALVGVCIARSLDLIVAILAVHKAGGAYVPLDPAYPGERIAFMLEDSRVSVLLTEASLLAQLPPHGARVVCVDSDAGIAAQSDENPESGARPEHLAYVIYTSGSTGKPKGVMVEHRNVVAFFHGMDEVIAHDPPGAWLAVTSLSFDISVLELFWTLARGFKVVVYVDRERGAPPAAPAFGSTRKVDFSIFMWGADDQASAHKYDLMLQAARFADDNGFAAVWTPERHFHAFGGPYPNPSVTSAAIAAVTSRVQVRAGSCVVPLHHPARVAEEWAVVDNLSHGRVGISFASGWQPDDFLLRPESFKDSKRVMAESIDMVRRLWRGEKLSFMGPLGKPVEVLTQPRPVQKELPFWVTTAGSPETYRLAGAMGANVLTHLLGQTVEEVGEKIRVYRKARADAGFDPETGIVSLMLHTFVGEDLDHVRELVREPMKSYLRSSVTLIKNFAWAFPAFKRPQGAAAKPEDIDLGTLTAEELDAILEFAFERYFEQSGLFGTPAKCLQMVERVRAAGVDDIACLIDFGVPTDEVAASLQLLAQVRTGASAAVREPAEAEADLSLEGQIARHRATHMQCTPSLARMLLTSDTGRAALKSLAHLMIGGEAFPVALAGELTGLRGPTVTNMYGPTETTIWSSTHRVQAGAASIPIGRPIANTQLYVLDGRLDPLPVGVPGELFIGGDGVVRGYLGRPELTAERFVPDPFSSRAGARIYRTGDIARLREDGLLEFLGRGDQQVKIRGHRIELGEIETVLNQQPSVHECVVAAREDEPGDQRLVAYVVAKGGGPVDVAEVRAAMRACLPEPMVPSHFVVLERLPLTPNGKVDRRVLPAPEAVQPRVETEESLPTSDLEQAIVAAWRETLGVQKVGARDNFFDLGGHSLLVVRLHRRLQPIVPRPLSITDLYRFPTIASLAAHLSAQADGGAVAESDRGEDRAKLRLSMRSRRRRGQDVPGE